MGLPGNGSTGIRLVGEVLDGLTQINAMKGIRFYLEFTDRSKRMSDGNVIAVLALNGRYWSEGESCYEAVAALFDQADSPVAGTGISLDYLRERCKRISEDKARKIHPGLFERLDRDSS